MSECARARVYALRIISTNKILRFINIFIIVIIYSNLDSVVTVLFKE